MSNIECPICQGKGRAYNTYGDLVNRCVACGGTGRRPMQWHPYPPIVDYASHEDCKSALVRVRLALSDDTRNVDHIYAELSKLSYAPARGVIRAFLHTMRKTIGPL